MKLLPRPGGTRAERTVMATWIQTTTATYKTGMVKTYGPTTRTADRMVAMFAQISFLRQAGEDITLDQEVDDNYHPIRYIIHRHLKDRDVVNVFNRVDDLFEQDHLQEIRKGQDFALFGQALRYALDDGETVALYDIRNDRYTTLPRAKVEEILRPAGYKLAEP